MSKIRKIDTKIWEDKKYESFSIDEKWFWHFLLTNDKLNNLGCYKITINQIETRTGFNKMVVKSLIERFENNYKMIKYDYETSEIFIINYSKYNWTKSPKFKKGIERQLEKIQSDNLRNITLKKINEYYEATKVKEPKTSEIATIKANTSVLSDEEIIIKQVIDMLNEIVGSRYTYKNSKNNSFILSTFNKGFKLEDFKTVIETKNNEWSNSDMAKYLRPETLFGNKFESYLNQSYLQNKKSEEQELQDYLLGEKLPFE